MLIDVSKSVRGIYAKEEHIYTNMFNEIHIYVLGFVIVSW